MYIYICMYVYIYIHFFRIPTMGWMTMNHTIFWRWHCIFTGMNRFCFVVAKPQRSVRIWWCLSWSHGGITILVLGHWFQRFRKNPRLRHKNHADRQAEILRVSCELTERLHNRALWWKTVVCGTGKSGTWRHHQSNADQPNSLCVQLLTTLMGRCINAYLVTIFHVHFVSGSEIHW